MIKLLEVMIQQVYQSDLPIAEKVRLISTLMDDLLRARKRDELSRLEAVEAVLRNRKEKKWNNPVLDPGHCL